MTAYGAAILFVVFGVLLAALDSILLALTPRLLPRLSRLAPSVRTDAILLTRSLPLALAASTVALVFLPAWWRHEPDNTGESVSALLAFSALLSVLPILLGAGRGARMFLRTRDRLAFWRGRGRSHATRVSPFEIVEVRSRDLALCVGGYLRPTIYASTAVVNSLEPSELQAALAHEVSHAQSRDPLRLLFMGACPDFLRGFSLDAPWRQAFARACEFAADARAACGNQEVALDLASALLKVARLHRSHPLAGDAALDVGVLSAYSSPLDLKARVEALANPLAESVSDRGTRKWTAGSALLLLAFLGAIASAEAHTLTEALGRFLAP